MPSTTALEFKKTMRLCYGLAALNQGDRLIPWAFERRQLRPDDIAVKVQFCGVCHSDLHAIRGNSRFPLVPGHEMVGMDFTPVLLTMGRRRLISSGSAGTLETQKMLDFCSKHNTAADVEAISAADINEGFDRLEQGDVHYRLVINMTTLKAPDGDEAKS